LLPLRWRVEEEQRADLRSRAHLVSRVGQLSTHLHHLGLVGRWWRRRRAAELRGQLADCRRRRERSGRRLAHLDAKLLVIDRTEHARTAWIRQARAACAWTSGAHEPHVEAVDAVDTGCGQARVPVKADPYSCRHD
jgi:hypothetical protein